MEAIITKSCTTIIGNSGTGKSFLSRHVTMKMMEQGYIITPCSIPKDVRQWFKHGRNTVFVFDDVCGRYTLNQQIFNEWMQRLDHIKSLLKDKRCQIISTCRQDVYKDAKFSSTSIFNMNKINLSSFELKLKKPKTSALAEMYIKDNTKKVIELSGRYDFFPLLCSLYPKHKRLTVHNFLNNPFDVFKDEIKKLYIEGDDGKMKYCGLALCVMLNNTLTEENMSNYDEEPAVVIEDLLVKCELNKGTSVKR